MKNKTGKIFSRAAALLLGVALIAGNVPIEAAFALTEEKAVDASFESYYDETEQVEVVTITTAALKEDIYITGIELPGGDYIEGSRAEYKAAENGSYDFVVYYKETAASGVSSNGAAAERTEESKEPEEVSAEGSVSQGEIKEDTAEEATAVQESIVPAEEPSSQEEAVVTEEAATPEEAVVTEEAATPEAAITAEEAVPQDNQPEEGETDKDAENTGLIPEVEAAELSPAKEQGEQLSTVQKQIFYYEVSRIPVRQEVVLMRSSLSVNALSTENDFIFNPDTQTITGYNANASKNVVVPQTINGVAVLHIGDSAFAGQQLSSVQLPEGILSIGESAFENNAGLTRINLPEGILSIGKKAFRSNASLMAINLPSSVTDIGSYAFSGCNSLKNMVIPDKVTAIGEWTFANCKSMTEITLPAGLESIGANAFYGCALTEIQLPSSLVNMGNSAFFGCDRLKKIVLPDGVTQIGAWSFGNCSSLTEVKLGNRVTDIGDSAFSNCFNLPKIELPEGLSTIGKSAFANCRSLTRVTIPGSVTAIGDSAFSACSRLTEIHIPDKEQDTVAGAPWGSNAGVYWKNTAVADDFLFNPVTGTITKYIGNKTEVIIPQTLSVGGVNYRVTGIGNRAFANANIVKVEMPDGISSIGKGAFQHTHLVAVEIPDSVTSIGESAFASTDLVTVKIPERITELEDGVFGHCKKLTEVILPEGLTSIGVMTFLNCDSLVDIKLPQSLIYIKAHAFDGCNGLTVIEIPQNVNVIDKWTFSDCSNLTEIHIPHKEKDAIEGAPWDSNAAVYWKDTTIVDEFIFEEQTGTILRYIGTGTEVVVPKTLSVGGAEYPVLQIGAVAFRDTGITRVELSDGITSIGDEAFLGCSSLSEITLPDSVTHIGAEAFLGCTSLREIKLPNNMTGLSSRAFSGCTGLVSISLPDSITVINYQTFKGCSSLRSLKLPKNLTEIEEDAFWGCVALTEVKFPESLKTIDMSAFARCEELTVLEIPSGVTSLSSFAFEGTTQLKTIRVNQVRDSSKIKDEQPWGADNSVTVKWLGEFVSFRHTLELIPGEYARNIDISAYIDKGTIINVTPPDGKRITVGQTTWPTAGGSYSYKVTQPGEYVFKGLDSTGEEVDYKVVVGPIGQPTLSARDVQLPVRETGVMTEAELLKQIQAKATTLECGEDFTGGTIHITAGDVEKVRKLTEGASTVITVTATSKTGLTESKEVTVTAASRPVYTFTILKSDGSVYFTSQLYAGDSLTLPTEAKFNQEAMVAEADRQAGPLTYRTSQIAFTGLKCTEGSDAAIDWTVNPGSFLGRQIRMPSHNVTLQIEQKGTPKITAIVEFVDEQGNVVVPAHGWDVTAGTLISTAVSKTLETFVTDNGSAAKIFLSWTATDNKGKEVTYDHTTGRFSQGPGDGDLSWGNRNKITFKARWKVITFYQVTFMDGLKNSVISTVSVAKGQSAAAPQVPVHEGYTFTGWDKDFSKITGNITVTAQYKKNTQTVVPVKSESTTPVPDKPEGTTSVPDKSTPVTPGSVSAVTPVVETPPEGRTVIEIDEPEPPTPPYPPIPVEPGPDTPPEPEPDTPDDPEPIQPPYGPVVQCILHWLLLGGAAAVLVAILVMRKRNEAEIRELLEQESEVA